MTKQAWCIKGPDGKLDTRTVRKWQRDSWKIFAGGKTEGEWQRNVDSLKERGFAAVPVTVSEQNAAQGIEVSERGPAPATAPSSPAAAPPCPDAEARKLADDFNRALNSYGFADMYLARRVVSALRGGHHDTHLSGKDRT